MIWVIQLVHYPAFRFVSELDFARFHNFHSARISVVVIPLMLAELICALIGLGQSLIAGTIAAVIFWSLNLTAIFVVWASTFLISVPLHNQLSKRKDLDIINKLVATNWIRTGIWTLRSLFLTGFVWM